MELRVERGVRMTESKWRRYVADSIATMYAGVFFTTVYCWFVDYFSSYPNQTFAFAFVSFIYLFWWEYICWKWRGLKSIHSAGYFILGSSIYLIIDMQWVIDRVFMFGMFLIVPLAIGAIVSLDDE